MRVTAQAVVLNQYAEFVCTDPDCDEGWFARKLPPIYLDLPVCPTCGGASLLVEALRRDSEM